MYNIHPFGLLRKISDKKDINHSIFEVSPRYVGICTLLRWHLHLGASRFDAWCVVFSYMVCFYLMLQRYNIPVAVFECFTSFFQKTEKSVTGDTCEALHVPMPFQLI